MNPRQILPAFIQKCSLGRKLGYLVSHFLYIKLILTNCQVNAQVNTQASTQVNATSSYVLVTHSCNQIQDVQPLICLI